MEHGFDGTQIRWNTDYTDRTDMNGLFCNMYNIDLFCNAEICVNPINPCNLCSIIFVVNRKI